jgi:transposase-like protein
MANRIRPLDEKVQSVRAALGQINIEKAARQAGIPASTLHYDLQKVEAAL